MNLLLRSFVLGCIGLTSFATSSSYDVLEDVSSTRDLMGREVGSSTGSLRGRELKEAWWDRVFASYPGKDLKQCVRRRIAPSNFTKCDDASKTCFFGTQECNSIGAHPTSKCTCNGTKGVRGIWTCFKESCPTTVVVDQAPALGKAAMFISLPEDPFEVKLNLLTPKVLEGYGNISDIKNDLTQAVRFYVNSIIEDQARLSDTFFSTDVVTRPVMMADSSAAMQSGAKTPSSPSAEGATDFATNNQEAGVDESDLVKSDGKFVYAAYGDIVVIWNATSGELVANYTLPPINDDIQPEPAPAPVSTMIDPGFVMGRPAIGFPIFFNPKPVIQGISLASDRLVLFVEGYGSKVRAERKLVSVFSNAMDTRIVILDTSTLPTSIQVISQTDVNGSFRDARSLGANVHAVTTSYINFDPLTRDLFRWNSMYQGMNSTEYKTAVVKVAFTKIDDFVATLLNDILSNGMAPSMPKISLWQEDLGNNTNIVKSIFSGGAIQAFVQLTSFSLEGLNGNATLSTAGVFTPSSWGYTYAVGEDLIFAAQGWNWSPWSLGTSQTTYFMGFKLNGASAKPAYLGSVDGYILNQYSLSIFEGHLRVATTVDSFWPIWDPLFSSTAQPVSRTNNTMFVMKIPTGNETVLKVVTGVPNLGKKDERITSVRCFKRICYLVTFLQTDPFYVLDMDPSGAKILGELQISGFSSYLHSINANDTLLVAVGQEADANGRILGVQVTLFDATNASNPVQLQRSIVEQDPSVFSSSSVQWDFKSFRWLSLGDAVGILILPLQIVSFDSTTLDGNFDGFVAYDVSRNGISKRLNISHVESSAFNGCYYQASLPQRSFVFNGSVTTLKGHSAVSTNLDTAVKRWTLDMPKPTNKDNCVFWLF